MWYNFAVDPVTKRQIVFFSCTTSSGFSKNGFAIARPNYPLLTPQVYPWDYLQNNHIWRNGGFRTAFVFDTKEEAEFACNLYLDFLKECGYVV